MAGANTERVPYMIVPNVAFNQNENEQKGREAFGAIRTLVKSEFAEVVTLADEEDYVVGVKVFATSDTAWDLRDFFGKEISVVYLGDKPEPRPFNIR